MTAHERLIVETIIRSIFTSTKNLCRFMEQLFSLIPDLAYQVQNMKDSGMTEDEIVQKIMAGVKEKQ